MRPLIFIQVKGLYDTHNHLDKRDPLMLGIGKGYVYWR